jgi:hypothetical protein
MPRHSGGDKKIHKNIMNTTAYGEENRFVQIGRQNYSIRQINLRPVAEWRPLIERPQTQA